MTVLPLRPRTRGDCKDAVRPCPWISCRHNLAFHLDQKGVVRLTFDDLDDLLTFLSGPGAGRRTRALLGELLPETAP